MKKQYHRNRGIIGSDYNICSSLNKSHHTVSVCNFNINYPGEQILDRSNICSQHTCIFECHDKVGIKHQSINQHDYEKR
jgi:hypothetical protein